MSTRKSAVKKPVNKNAARPVARNVKTPGGSKAIKKEKQQMNQTIKAEVIIITVLTSSVLLALCIFTEGTGALGGFVKKVFYSVFGAGASFLPFAAMLGCVFAGFKKFRKSSRLKNSLICVLFFSVISIFHVMYLNVNTILTEGPFEYIAYFAKSGGNKNGGIAGALIGGPLVKIIGTTGAYVILVSVCIICAVIITERSVFELLADAAVKTKDTALKLNEERKKHFPVKNRGDVSRKTGGSAFEGLKSKISSSGQSFNHKLKWGEVEEYENLSYDQKKEFVENNPEVFGFSDEDELIVNPEPQELIVTQEAYEAPEYSDEVAISGLSDIIIENFDEPDLNYEDKPPFEEASEEADYLYQDAGSGISQAAPKAPQSPPPSTPETPATLHTSISNEFIDYDFPPLELLRKGENGVGRDTRSLMLKNAQKLEDTLKSFGVIAKVVQINKGPTVTRYELTPDSGVKVSRIVGLADDIALNLASDGIRIEAPVPGKPVVGIEVPNKDRTPVLLREVLESPEFQKFESRVAFGVGKDIGGSAIVTDISDMPHLLIAGATGAGKSVCINTLITSILYKASPNEVKLILIDPKVVELGVYDGIPHLLLPVVTDAAKAASALNWAVHQMNDRYNLFKEENVRDLKGYNDSKAEKFEFDAILPKIVIIIDELSDLMMTAPKDVEDSIMRLAQKARAAGLHLVLATQRPSVDVITGVIKANIPSRLAFAVSSGTDSRTILDMVGAEKLLGRGDMLFSPRDIAKPVRIQGAFISDKEVEGIVAYIKQHAEAEYDESIIAEITTAVKVPQNGASGDSGGDELYDEVLEFVLTKKEVSVSMLQRQFRIGYNRAARIMDTLESNGIVSENTAEGTGKPSRKVLGYGGE